MSQPKRRHPNVVNLEDVAPLAMQKGTRFGMRTRRLGTATGAAGLGCSWYEVEAGRSAFPRHFHCANEESLFVLEGEGTLRLGDAEVSVRAGDYVTLPVGPTHAHELVNTGTAPLRYLCFSTLHTVEVVGYPDSKKVAALAAPDHTSGKLWVREIFRSASAVDYYDGEDVE